LNCYFLPPPFSQGLHILFKVEVYFNCIHVYSMACERRDIPVK
jgi:hypothetical protein